MSLAWQGPIGNNTSGGLLPWRQLQVMTRFSLQGGVPGYLWPVSGASLRLQCEKGQLRQLRIFLEALGTG